MLLKSVYNSRTSDRLLATIALLGKELAVAVNAVRFVIVGQELISSKHLVTLRAAEAVAVPCRAFVTHTSLVDHLSAARQLIMTSFTYINQSLTSSIYTDQSHTSLHLKQRWAY